MPAKRPPVKPSHMKFEDKLLVDTYIWARQGLSNSDLQKALNISDSTFLYWTQTKPAFVYAIDMGRRKDPKAEATWKDFVFGRLTEHQKEVWNEIHFWDNSEAGVERVEALFLGERGDVLRKQMFLHALVHSNFNVTAACRLVNIGRQVAEGWKRDVDFAEMVDAVLQMKKDFYESCLIDLAASGNTLAIVFANRTLNRDRGYGDKVQVEVNGTLNHHHLHAHVSVDQLELPLDVRRTILNSMRRLKAPKRPVELDDVHANLGVGVLTPVNGVNGDNSDDD